MGRGGALQSGNRCRPESPSRFYEEVARGRLVYRRYSPTVRPLIDSSTRKVILLTWQRSESRSMWSFSCRRYRIRTTRFGRPNALAPRFYVTPDGRGCLQGAIARRDSIINQSLLRYGGPRDCVNSRIEDMRDGSANMLSAM